MYVFGEWASVGRLFVISAATSAFAAFAILQQVFEVFFAHLVCDSHLQIFVHSSQQLQVSSQP
jgi:hypothetical protein